MIYLVAALKEGVCKIGFTKNVESRLAAIRTSCPFELELIAIRKGGKELEFSIHRAAKKFHIRREWFKFNSDIVDLFENCQESQITAMPCAKQFAPSHETHSGILRSAGSIKDIADLCGVASMTVYSWMHRNRIPGGYWMPLVRAGKATLEQLAEGARRVA